MDPLDYSGQTLDGKYRIDRELGRGGMGTVYLATHLGTERPVAIKIISPQYMQRSEFVERFRREARAAGRLRHPNVVNVTDFGFSETRDGQAAYLVMEYLDGCTLGEILDEEKNLPVSWTLDILEQVCSAVHEAHQQGIIHRDLKPDNIWLEPNQRGGYTVKVLDFGIAKLEELDDAAKSGEVPEAFLRSTDTLLDGAKTTFGGVEGNSTQAEGRVDTRIAEADTLAQTADHSTVAVGISSARSKGVNTEAETAIFDDGDISSEYEDTVSTRISSNDGSSSPEHHSTAARSLYDARGSAELTRVGAVLGTPLYMSPEQCRGEHLDPRSDIYSLGVIAYQMLSGAPPFEGDFKSVMEAHSTTMPPPLTAKKARRKLKRVIHSALAKEREDRPMTAEAFSSELRARSEGIIDLFRRALVIYSEQLPKFLMLTGFFSIPMAVLTFLWLIFAFLKISDVLSTNTANVLLGGVSFFLSIATAFCTNLIVGTIAWIVTQHLAVPLRPIRLRPAMKEARKKWKRMAGAGVFTALLPFVASAVGGLIGFTLLAMIVGAFYPVSGSWESILIGGAVGAVIAGAISFIAAHMFWVLVPPVIVMEDLGIADSLKRSMSLVRRSISTSAGTVFIMFLIPMIVVGTISFVVNISAKAFDPTDETKIEQTESKPADAAETPPAASEEEEKKDGGFNFSFGGTKAKVIAGDEMDMRAKVKGTILESLIQILWLPMQIFVFSFSGIIVALLYMKTRLAGGESMNDLIERFEDDGRPRKKWQERVRKRLMQSGRLPSKP